MKTVKEIIVDYCKSIGADGLCNLSIPCGCGLDEFCNMEADFGNCRPAKLTKCTDCEFMDDWMNDCEIRFGYDCDECYKPVQEVL